MRPVLIAALALLAACSPRAKTADTPAEPEANANQTLPLQVESNIDQSQYENVVASMNPLENDLRGLEVAVRLEDAFVVKSDGAVLHIGATAPGGEQVVDELFVLAPLPEGAAGFLAPLAREGFTVHTFNLSDADLARMAATQAHLQEVRDAAPGQNELTFEASAYTCVAAGKDIPDVYRFNVFVRSAPTVDFVDMGGEITFRPEDSPAAAQLFQPCES